MRGRMLLREHCCAASIREEAQTAVVRYGELRFAKVWGRFEMIHECLANTIPLLQIVRSTHLASPRRISAMASMASRPGL